MRRVTALLRARKGSATVEFALTSLFLFGVLVVGLDFAMYAQQKLRLGDAVEQGAMIAFRARTNAPTVDTSGITSYIASVAGGTPTISFECNGSSSCGSGATQSACVSAPAAANGWPTFTASTTTCASGGSPGYYLVIRATRVHSSVIVPDKWLGGTTIVQQAVVRLS
ncbi:TadE/TadG family type IV pilus assembly protein [Sphingomonas nostoxanthinifaciens]|uniref:TadE/TadG family type IV pilus assembly protein n=1 Tax=Sphingomonas nostoxanthinifaciens TaxID=2872652 RepID=UPI001CC21584|nr:TadE/TadG family type IV pilus assembly protein [Sphingomonas nostoxanthinifaciens]UAK25107.1 pilus assembly protein [Sphingomonas nostoxanthinifaciens]